MALVLFELPGRCTSAPAASERAGGLRRALSPTFRAGSDAAHYPLAGVGAADSGAVNRNKQGDR